MAAFLHEHTRPFHRIVIESPLFEHLQEVSRVHYAQIDEGDLRDDPTQFIHVGSEIAYGDGPSKIGFNYGTSGYFGPYMHGVCAWMALKGGRRRQLNCLVADAGYLKAVPYYTLDHEPFPVLVQEDLTDLPGVVEEHFRKHWLIDPWGLCPDELIVPRWHPHHTTERFMGVEISRTRLLNQIARAEIQRLELLWSAQG
jgi:hypothetical protein